MEKKESTNPLRESPENLKREEKEIEYKVEFTPVGKKLLVRPYEEAPRPDQIIVEVKVEKEKPRFGYVLAKGPSPELRGVVMVDDRIAFPPFAGQPITMFGQELLMIEFDDIYGVFKEIKVQPGEIIWEKK